MYVKGRVIVHDFMITNIYCMKHGRVSWSEKNKREGGKEKTFLRKNYEI